MEKQEKRFNESKIKEFLIDTANFNKAKLKYEQYMTPTDLALRIVQEIQQRESNLDQKTGFDLGCGTGMLTQCLVYLGFKNVVGIDVDKDCVDQTELRLDEFMPRFIEKYDLGYDQETEIIYSDILEFDISNTDYKCDLVLMNPPFGTKNSSIDSQFLQKAFQICNGNIYSVHKGSSLKQENNKETIRNFLKKLAEQNQKELEIIIQDYQYQLPKQDSFKIINKKTNKLQKHHKKELATTLVDFVCFKNKNQK